MYPCGVSVTSASTSRRATPRRREVTRERLLDAARTLLVREGLHGVSVERLCDEAGFTRGAFYSNFETKDELVVALVEREQRTILDAVRHAADSASVEGLPPEQAVAAILERFLIVQPPDRDWFVLHLELELRGLRGEAGGDGFLIWWHVVMDGIAEILQSAVDALGLRLTIDVQDACMVLIGTWEAMVLRSLVADRPLDDDMLRTTLPRVLVSLTEPD